MSEPGKENKKKQHIQTAPVVPVRDTVHFPGVIQTILVGREVSIAALQDSLTKEREVIILGQLDQSIENPKASDLYKFGTLSEVLHVLPLPDGTMRVVLRGMARVKISGLTNKKGAFQAQFSPLNTTTRSGDNIVALIREITQTLESAMNLGLQIPPEVAETIHLTDDPALLADTIAHHLPITSNVKQELLEEIDSEKRLLQIAILLSKELEILTLQNKIRNKVESELGQTQREYYLREQIRAIQEELGGEEFLGEEGEKYRQKFLTIGMPTENLERAMQEVRRLERSPSSSPEAMVIRNYLEWLSDIPWNTETKDQINVQKAARILNKDHYGLEQVKDRILDFLAVRQVSNSLRGPILCFVGPPGVGKTSIGKSIAEALGRKFHRLSLGGIRDEAEIRGHRRTYIGSMPGRLIQGLKQCKTKNPVFMLDEIDKMTSDLRGDPTSALLECLDPEQNQNFSDHYIEMPVDLSSVMFIATANYIEDIPAPLRDRMEIIRFPSYTEEEKQAIAIKYLVPKKLVEHGLKKDQLTMSAFALKTIIREYTREAGVRSLEREIATLCRKAARFIAEGNTQQKTVNDKNLNEFLGRPRYRYGVKSPFGEVGIATGLVYSEYGGDIISIETNLTAPYGEQPTVRLTGSLGDVMKESAMAAMSFIRNNQAQFSSSEEFKYDIHIHVPAGAVPKDGPSAGVTLVTALASSFSNQPVRSDVAMTGEISLRGKVLPVGGIREKVLAAHRAGIRTIIIPFENDRDLDDLPKKVRDSLKIHLVNHVNEALKIALQTKKGKPTNQSID